ncbi:MAG: cohesin domain-containing protein [Cyanobacteria bacterium P01_F01_bin.150]
MNNLMRHTLFVGFAAGAMISLGAGRAEAVTFGIQPSSPNLTVGDSLSVDLTVSDLGDLSAPSVSVFDLDIAFDNSILNFDTLTFGNALDLGIGFSFQGVDAVSTPGTVSLFEVSFASPLLDSLQPGSITLATLMFDAVGVGTTSINPTMVLLGDAIGGPLTPSSVSGASATVLSDASGVESVPFPGFAFLPSSLIAIFGGLGLKRKASKLEMNRSKA